ncbi:hypothetical protein TBR22_A32740 [Luteitalea sp. TBR-22]|uniref:hypothetical protein n=1 Tax=Luteitalea sp. TBR-22 TaxID=2802971 RepID=UPI001AF08E4B|nr:hypothetical protein [Luteitalea sp. TBR-22]BCS34045.1 hypothetical protein TBR22_A32740 [Luteitalea sp. TBR-22]
MRHWVRGMVMVGLVLGGLAQTTDAQDLKAKLAAVKQAAAANQQELRTYTWLEKTELSLKGEVKATKVDSCRYGPDGKVVRTPVVTPPPAEKKRGLRGRVVAKKTGEMKEELQATAALIHEYVPPAPDRIQVVMNAGTASVGQAGPERLAFTFPGYAKQGDALKITFDKAITALQQIDVTTWLDKPEDVVTLHVTMQALPGGPRFPGTVLLTIASSQLQVKITKSNYQKLAM